MKDPRARDQTKTHDRSPSHDRDPRSLNGVTALLLVLGGGAVWLIGRLIFGLFSLLREAARAASQLAPLLVRTARAFWRAGWTIVRELFLLAANLGDLMLRALRRPFAARARLTLIQPRDGQVVAPVFDVSGMAHLPKGDASIPLYAVIRRRAYPLGVVSATDGCFVTQVDLTPICHALNCRKALILVAETSSARSNRVRLHFDPELPSPAVTDRQDLQRDPPEMPDRNRELEALLDHDREPATVPDCDRELAAMDGPATLRN